MNRRIPTVLKHANRPLPLALLLVPLPALAHPGHGLNFEHGLLHALAALGTTLALFAVALLVSRLGKRAGRPNPNPHAGDLD